MPADCAPDERTGPTNPVTLRVCWMQAYHRLVRKRLPSHRGRGIRGRRHEIALAGDNFANKDFELGWTLAPGRAPAAALFTERKGERHYGLLMVVPPAQERSGPAIPREAIFVIDTSGSMSGASIAQAREALELAIRRLTPADRFNVIEFNSYARALFSEARPADAGNLDAAVRWVRELRAQGGTEMAKALDLALDGKEHPGRIRQIVSSPTGGCNEDPLLR